MRSVILTAILISLTLGPSTLVASEQGGQQADDVVVQPGEHEEETDNEGDEDEEKDERSVQEAWGEIFSPVEAYNWEFEGGAGFLQWRNAYGAYGGEPLFRLRTRYSLTGPLTVSLAADHSHRTNETRPLAFTNRRISLGAGVGLHHWMGRWVVGADAELLGIYDRRTLNDATGSTADSRLRPAAGVGARFGVAMFSTAAVSLETSMRIHAQGVEPLFGLTFSWFL